MIELRAFLKVVVFLGVLTALVVGDGFTTIEVGGGEFVFGISDFQLPFDDAVESCKSNNMTLLAVDTAEKDRLLMDTFFNGGSNVTLPGPQSWIAARELEREGVWVSVPDNQPLYYSRWSVDQPDDIENLSCAFQNTLPANMLYWRDGNCSASFYFVCETSAQRIQS